MENTFCQVIENLISMLQKVKSLINRIIKNEMGFKLGIIILKERVMGTKCGLIFLKMNFFHKEIK